MSAGTETRSQPPAVQPEVLDLLGSRIQHLTPLTEGRDGYCLMQATVPPGVFVPVHAHADRETFYIQSGEIEGLMDDAWGRYGPGAVFDVPGGIRHAFRNMSGTEVSLLIVTTMGMGRFFQRMGRPLAGIPPGPPSPAELRRFAEASLAEGHWLGDVADNAEVGIRMSFT